MKRLLLCTALLCGGALFFQDISSGHGGTYRGPGDTVPPGGGGGGGGGSGTPQPGSPGPTTGGGSGGGAPSTPKAPTTGGGGGRPTGASTGGAMGAAEPNTWDYWWGFNKDQYLNLKAAIHDGGVASGSDEHFLSQGQTKQAKNHFKPSEESIRTKVVPALKEALEKERSNDIVTGCLIALGKIGDVKNGDDGSSEFEPIISRFLTDKNQEIAETAAVALGILANDASVQTLKGLALDNDDGRKAAGGTSEVAYRTRAFAAYGLGLIGHRTAKNEVRQEIARTLIDMLERPDTSTRDVKVAALVALGLVPIDVDQSESPRVDAGHDASRQSQIAYVRKLFLDPQQDHLVRAHAPTTLARLLVTGQPRGDVLADVRADIGRLLTQQIGPFSKAKDAVQQSCVLALGMIGTAGPAKVDADIRAALVRIAGDPNQQLANFGMIALAQVGARGLGDEFLDGRREAREFILTQLTSGKSHIRPWAGLAVGVLERALLDDGQLASDDALTVLRAGLRDAAAPEKVGAYAIGLGIARDDKAQVLLFEKMKATSEANAKGFLCLSLGLLGGRDKVVIEELRRVVEGAKYKPELLRQAAIGLGLLGDKELVDELVTTLRQANTLASQAAVATALGFIGDSRSIDPLVEMLKAREGATDTARGFAAVALGIVADKEMMPWNAKISTNINYRASTSTLTGEAAGILDIL